MNFSKLFHHQNQWLVERTFSRNRMIHFQLFHSMTHTVIDQLIIRNQNLQAQAKKPEITEAEELDEDSIDESGF